MLEWMQRHKKYLVVTIWVSVIALVFAGMVGWNPSDISFAGNNVAKVGKIKISDQEFQYTFQRVFNEYNQMVGGDLDMDQAKNFQLDNITLQQLIQKAQLQNFALDLGLRVQDREIIEVIEKNESFQRDGTFDKKLYREVLKNNNLNVKFFEQSVRDSLLIQKLLEFFPASTTQLERRSIGGSIALTDTIEYEVLSTSPIKQQITEQKLKDFWEKNKANYTNPATVTLEIAKISPSKQKFDNSSLQNFYNENKTLYLDSNGQLQDFSKVEKKVQADYQDQKAKESALRLKPKFRKNELKDLKTQKLTIALDEKLSADTITQLKDARIGDTINPILYQGDYVIGNVITKQEKNTKDFASAKEQARKDLQKQIMLEELKALAQKQLPNFKGKTIKINNLGEIDFSNLDKKHAPLVIRNIFLSSEKSGVVLLDSQAFLYRITKQELPNQIPENVVPIVQNIKNQYISQELLNYVSKKYPAKIYNNHQLENRRIH